VLERLTVCFLLLSNLDSNFWIPAPENPRKSAGQWLANEMGSIHQTFTEDEEPGAEI